jgi:hypothetical protein
LRFTTFSYRFQNIFERQTEYRNSHLTDSPWILIYRATSELLCMLQHFMTW